MWYYLKIINRFIYLTGIIMIYTPLIWLNKREIADMISKMGVFYIKTGQIITTRPDIFGNNISKHCRKLQDKVAKSKRVPQYNKKIIKLDSEDPIACGSIAEVYKGWIDGGEVIIKMKRDHLEEYLEVDKYLINMLINSKIYQVIVSRIFDDKLIDQSKDMFEVMSKTINEHLNFEQEVQNLKRMKLIFSNHPHIIIPNVFESLCDDNYIILEYISGISLFEAHNDIILTSLMNVIFDMIFIHQLIHGDLHDGNILIQGDKIVLLDFGLIYEILDKHMFIIKSFFILLHSLNSDLLSQYMYTYHDKFTLPYSSFKQDLQQLVLTYNPNNPNLYLFLSNLIDLSRQYKLNIDKSLLPIFMLLISADGIARKYSTQITMSLIINQRLFT